MNISYLTKQSFSYVNKAYIKKNAEYKNSSQPNFCSASDITAAYAYKTKKHLLPPAVIKMIEEFIKRGKSINISLKDFHEMVYKKLLGASNIDEIKEFYDEFKSVKDATSLAGNKSKAIEIIKNNGGLDIFTSEYIKKLYMPMTLAEIVNQYGFSNISVLNWLNEKLGIPKLQKNYLMLLKLCNEDTYEKFSAHLRSFKTPEIEEKRIASVKVAQQKDSYKEAQRERINHHRAHPEISKTTSAVNKRMWKLCPDVKERMHNFASTKPDLAKILKKIECGISLTPEDKSRRKYYNKLFWVENPDCRKKLSEARKRAIEELKTVSETK